MKATRSAGLEPPLPLAPGPPPNMAAGSAFGWGANATGSLSSSASVSDAMAKHTSDRETRRQEARP